MKLTYALGSQWIATSYVAVLSVLLAFFLGRILGPTGFAEYSYVLSVAAIYAIFQDGGYRTLLFRENTQKTTGFNRHIDLLSLALGHVFVVTGFGLFVLQFLPVNQKSALNIALICFSLVTFSAFISAIYKGKGLFPKEAGWQMLARTLTALFILGAVFLFTPKIENIFLAWSAGLIFALSLPLARILWRQPIFRPNTDILRSCAAFLTIDAATAIYFRSDIVLLRHLVEDVDQVGYYAAAYRLLEGVILFMTPVAHIVFRSLRLTLHDSVAFISFLVRLLVIMLGVAFIIFWLGYVFGREIIQFTFGEEFKPAGSLVAWLFSALFVILPNYILTQSAIALNHEKYYAIAAVLAALLNIVLNFFLIPEFGSLGAALATLATEILLCISLLFRTFLWIRANNENRR